MARTSDLMNSENKRGRSLERAMRAERVKAMRE